MNAFLALICLGACCASIVEQADLLQGAVKTPDGYTLAPGPNVEGVALLHQGEWTQPILDAFFRVPWLDAASIRLPWRDLEPEDGQFDWGPIDRLLAAIKQFNTRHPDQRRTLHIRPMAGRWCPRWFEARGVRFYRTTHVPDPGRPPRPIRVPVPYENPEFIGQLRELYRAVYERYKDEPLVTVYHGTWSGGPWDEIFHPQGGAPLPPDYTPEKFVQGMVEQLDVLIEEFCLKGKVAELPFSGKYPPRSRIDITGPLVRRAVERLGRRSPFLYIQSNAWGMTNTGRQSICWGHEEDINAAYGLVNLALQALGTNAGGGWRPQGDWVGLVRLAQLYDAAYLEIYPPDLRPLDTEHRIVEAFTAAHGPDGFVGFRPWLRRRARVLYVREGVVRRTFTCGAKPRRVERLVTVADVPSGTWVRFRARTRMRQGSWSEWREPEKVNLLPAGTHVQVEALLHTDDGCLTPVVKLMEPATGPLWAPPLWQPVAQ